MKESEKQYRRRVRDMFAKQGYLIIPFAEPMKRGDIDVLSGYPESLLHVVSKSTEKACLAQPGMKGRPASWPDKVYCYRCDVTGLKIPKSGSKKKREAGK